MRLPHTIRRQCTGPEGRRPAAWGGRLARRGVPGLLAVALALSFAAAPAHASYELVETFGEGSPFATGEEHDQARAEEGLNDQPGGIAVNDTTGDVYVADAGNNRVMRFDSQGHFREAWGWGVGDYKEEYERCGPEGEISECAGRKTVFRCESEEEITKLTICKGEKHKEEEGTGYGVSGEGAGEFQALRSIVVDQATGHVFVESGRRKGVIQVFSGKGTLITSFGEVSSEPVSVAPEMMREEEGAGNEHVVVDPGTGDVYRFDAPDSSESRVMVFKPKTPARQEYEYAEELFAGQYTNYARGLAEDANGDFYISHDEVLYKFDKGDYVAPAWEKAVPEGGGMAVEPVSGDLLRYQTHSTKIERFSAVNGAVTEKFSTGEAGLGFDALVSLLSLALNPNVSWTPGRPPGVLYGDVPISTDTHRPAHMLALVQLPVAPPKVDSESASFIGSSSATLTAQVNPDGYETRFRFQYGTEACSAHPCSEAPLGSADLGSGAVDLAAGVELSGLRPETTYHYRVLATNLYGGTTEGREQTFTTYPTTTQGLPDGRVYEMVSPPEKDGGEVFPPNASIASCEQCKPGEGAPVEPMQSAPTGDAVVYEGNSFATTGDAVKENEYRSKRTATGWQTEDLSPANESPGIGKIYTGFSADLSAGVLPWGEGGYQQLSPEAPAGYENAYLREADGAMRPLLTATPPGSTTGFKFEYAGASPNFSHILFEANYALTGETPFAPAAQKSAPGKFNLYEWVGGQLRLVNVLPGNTTAAPDAVLGGKADDLTTAEGTNAVSADGSRVFWTDTETGQSYVRENGESTVEIPDPNRFLIASSDGMKVLLADGLIFDLSGETPVESANLTNGLEGFQGILGASSDLSRVYFVDTEPITGSEQNDRGATAQAGGDNLYLYDQSSGSTRYVATLAPEDNRTEANSLAGDWQPSVNHRLAHVTLDGRYATFMSHLPLTGYENQGKFEVFEYDASSGTLSCASCNPAGVPPLGESRLPLIEPFVSRYLQPKDLSENGRVFFDSQDVLSPYDGNGSVEDVYEYEPGGVGTCTRTGGCVFLISSGHSPDDSNFVAASESGNDVFFITRDRLSPNDQDELYDLYDARVNGGFAEVTSPACTGTGCQGLPGAPPIFATPSSVTFAGVGNFEASASGTSTVTGKAKTKNARCPKGKKLKRGRCVRARAGARVHRARSGSRGRGATSGGAHTGARRAK